jgi:hypothetical protein
MILGKLAANAGGIEHSISLKFYWQCSAGIHHRKKSTIPVVGPIAVVHITPLHVISDEFVRVCR